MALTDRFGESWRGRRTVVVGLGKSGIAAATWLRRIGAQVAVTEASDTPALRAVAASLGPLGVDRVELGGHTEALIRSAELVVTSPGVPETARPLQWAQRLGRPIMSEVELAYQFCPSPIIGVTGTNGKSTVVSLLADLLTAVRRPAVACGNLGIPFCSVLEQLRPDIVAVVEASSFQLVWCDRLQPMIGVLLNLGAHHLDRHRDRSGYLAAKRRLFQRQTADDWAILNGCDPELVAMGEQLPARRVWFGDNRSNAPAFWLAPATRRALSDNAQAVLQVARVLGIPDPLTWQCLRSFHGLEHRLESVVTIRGVRFVNDSKSTSATSCRYAIAQTPGDLVVIAGGRADPHDLPGMADTLYDPRVKGLVLFGESRERLRALFNGSPAIRETASLEEAVAAAVTMARPGTTVLFSPGCVSFDLFRNFEERGRAFKTIVHRLEARS